MSTEATDRLAIGEIGADAPAGQHTNEQAGSHDCELVVAPTGQGITASLEARAGRTLLPAESNIVQNMTTDSNSSLTPREEEVQKPASAPSVQPQSSNGCTPEVASGSPVSTLSNTSENKPEGVNLPAAAEGEPSAEAEFGSSAATNSNQSKAMKAYQIEKVSSGQAEEDAQVNTCEQTVQPSVEINACAAAPGETEQIASHQAEPPSAVSTDSTNSDAAAIASANLNSGTDFVASTNTNTVMNTTSTTTTVQTDDASAVTVANQNSNAVDYSTFPDIHPEAWVEIFNDVLLDETPGTLGHRGFNASEFSIEEGGAYLEVCLTADDEGILKIENADDSEEVLNITAQLPEGEWTHLDDADYWQRVEYKYLPEGNYRIIHHLYNNPDYGTTNNRALYRFK
ncbi:MAG: hypothetical protein IJN29_01960, partial [Akkermansia sp.]|nr:hypothetical protein [Akkermansia sp.]